MILGPVAALWNQALIYATAAMTCGRAGRAPLHAIAAACLAVALATALFALRARRKAATNTGSSDDEQRRTRFMTLVAVSTAVFSSLVIIAQWMAVMFFTPCMKA